MHKSISGILEICEWHRILVNRSLEQHAEKDIDMIF